MRCTDLTQLADILLIEENPQDREHITAIITDSKIQNDVVVVTSEEDVASFLDTCKSSNNYPDIVMFGLTGNTTKDLAMIKQISQSDSHHPIYLVVLGTSEPQIQAIQSCNRDILNTVIKPLTRKSLLEAVAKVETFRINFVTYMGRKKHGT